MFRETEDQYSEIPRYSFRDYVISLGNTPTPICEANTRRVILYFSLMGVVNHAWLRPHAEVDTDVGFHIHPDDALLRVSWRDDAILPMLSWSGQCSGAGEDLYVMEVEYNPSARLGRE